MIKIGIKKGSLAWLELVPYAIHAQGVSALGQADSTAFFKKLKDISLPLDDPEQLEASWNGFLHHYGSQGFVNDNVHDHGKTGNRTGQRRSNVP